MKGGMARGIALRFAIGSSVVALVGIVVVALGVAIIGQRSFTDLMVGHGIDTAEAEAMFQESVQGVLLGAVAVAIATAIVLATVMGMRLGRPLRQLRSAARRIAQGDYSARLPADGPAELQGLIESFEAMRASLDAHERVRRDFIANAAHELNTPLTNLKGYLEALRDGVLAADAAAYESLLEEVERLVRLSRSLDTLAQQEAPPEPVTAVPVDLSDAIRSAVEFARPNTAASGLEFVIDVPSHLVARAVPDHVRQVLGNLLQNAVRYTEPGGRVAVHAEQRPGDVLVSVTNTGEEIPAEDVPHLFERFYRVEKSRAAASGGAGIGLAIVRELVEALEGTVGAASRDGQNRFWFTLPASPVQKGHTLMPRMPASAPGARRATSARRH